jgi:hypothetical protein
MTRYNEDLVVAANAALRAHTALERADRLRGASHDMDGAWVSREEFAILKAELAKCQSSIVVLDEIIGRIIGRARV